MPIIEYNLEGEVYELKTAPPDGFIKARALSYDEMLTRRDMAAKMIYRQRDSKSGGNGRGPSRGIGNNKQRKDPTDEEMEMMMETANKAVQTFQFSTQIVDHNLTFPDGTRVNFANAAHLRRIPSKIGAEIESILDSLNEEDLSDESEGDFPEQSTPSSVPTTSAAESES